MDRDEAAARRLVFRGTFLHDSIVGTGLEVSVFSRSPRAWRIDRARGLGLWLRSRVGRGVRIWFQFIHAAPSDSGANGYAARFDPVRDRSPDLGEDSKARDLECTGSPRAFSPSRGGHVNQRPDRLRLFVAGTPGFSMENA